MSKKLKVVEPWYEEGLRFKCTGCGKCCTGGPGYTWITQREAEQIAAYLEVELKDFLLHYTKKVGKRTSLIERKRGKNRHDCIFLQDKGCTIYPVRPTQCRTYPYWPEVIDSPLHWQKEAKYCEGINHENAPTVERQAIEKELNTHIQAREEEAHETRN